MNSRRIRHLIKSYPHWTAKQIADAAGVSASSVHNVAYRAGLTLPKAHPTPRKIVKKKPKVLPVQFTSPPVYGRSYTNAGYVKLS